MKTLRCLLGMLGQRWRSWLAFEALFQLLSLSLVGPCLKLTVDAAMALNGYHYLTWENVKTFVVMPVSIILIVLWAIVLALSSVFNYAGLHYALTYGGQKERVHLIDTVRYALRRTWGALRPRNIVMVPYLVILLPLTNLGTSAGLVRAINLPEFIMEYVETNTVLGIAYIVVMLALSAVALLYLFCNVFFVAQECSFGEAAREAREAGRHHFWIDTIRVLILPSVPLLILMIPLLLLLVLGVLASGDVALWLAIFITLFMLVAVLISAPSAYACCLAMLRLRDVEPASPAKPEPSSNPAVVPVVSAVVLVASLAGGAFFVAQNIISPLQTADQLSGRKMQLTAHRGGSFAAPENTMAAFRKAKEGGADICELDVQQSSDGVIFVSHDSNFLRVSGVDKGAWELTWAQIQKLDATGEFWEGRVEPQGYPLLDEVVAWAAENDMQLNIELKPTGHETNFEQAVVDIVNAHDFGTRCVVTSQTYDTVARVNELNPDITCIYVTTLAYGAIWELDAVDGYSIEANSATAHFVSSLHKHDKRVFAWVVNSAEEMRKMGANGVDDLITDDVPLGREMVDEANSLTPGERLFFSLIAMFV
ncbi:MAG: glycerophosphodiester phosphodiesterase family protein [Coriobacteriales bacterium]|nr:glycerophosphodiester phosphodiesterase family protein [Coriobacteriales bacterium]